MFLILLGICLTSVVIGGDPELSRSHHPTFVRKCDLEQVTQRRTALCKKKSPLGEHCHTSLPRKNLAWNLMRDRCRPDGGADWSYTVHIFRVRKTEDILAMWYALSGDSGIRDLGNMTLTKVLPRSVWTSGTKCPRKKVDGIIVVNRWTPHHKFPDWLAERLKNTPFARGRDDDCIFLVIDPSKYTTDEFVFQDEFTKHAAVCEFAFPGLVDWSKYIPTTPSLNSRASVNNSSTNKISVSEERKSNAGKLWTSNSTFSGTMEKSEHLMHCERDMEELKTRFSACCDRDGCEANTCYAMEWRASAWSAVRDRCQAREGGRWPYALDVFRLRDEQSILEVFDVLQKAFGRRDPSYISDMSVLPRTVWTSGTRCPRRTPEGIVTENRWTSNQKFPDWLEVKLKDTPLEDDNLTDCKFLVITPFVEKDEIKYEFQDEWEKHSGICEFIFPGVVDWSTIIPITTSTLAPTTTSLSTSTTKTTVPTTSTTTSTTVPTTSTTTRTTVPTTTTTTTTVPTTSTTTTAVPTTSTTTRTTVPTTSTTTTAVPTTSTTTRTTVPTTSTTTTVPTTSTTTRTTVPITSTTTKTTVPTTSTIMSISTTSRTTVPETTTQTTRNSSCFCESRSAFEITWPKTNCGTVANVSCPNGFAGYAQWACDEKTVGKPNITNCRHKWIADLENDISEEDNVYRIAAELANRTSLENMSHGDISAVVNLSEKMLDVYLKHRYTLFAGGITTELIQVFSNVLREENKHAWEYLPRLDQGRDASRILKLGSSLGTYLSCVTNEKSKDENLQFTVTSKNINLQTFILHHCYYKNSNCNSGYDSKYLVFPQSTENRTYDSFIRLPIHLLEVHALPCKGFKSASGIIYERVADYLQKESLFNSTTQVVAPVISFSIGNTSNVIRLSEGDKVTITFKHTVHAEENQVKENGRCVFWNYFKGVYGEWDNSGCEMKSSNSTHSKCSCNHLTNFAVLMDINAITRPDSKLTIVTIICCSFSAFALIATIVCFITIKKLRCKRRIITGNLCFCLLVMDILIVFGLDKTEHKLTCKIIAGSLQFWILSAFFWMFIEAYNLYRMAVTVLYDPYFSTTYYMLFAYGIPAFIVAFTAGVQPDAYGGKDFCWISNENGLLWTVVGPQCVILVANFIIYCLTIRSATTLQKNKTMPFGYKFKKMAIGSASIWSILGIGWAFGFLYSNEYLYNFSYLFTALNGLQGVFIFVFHIVLNENFRAAMRNTKAVGSTESTPQHTNVAISSKTLSNSSASTVLYEEDNNGYAFSEKHFPRHACLDRLNLCDECKTYDDRQKRENWNMFAARPRSFSLSEHDHPQNSRSCRPPIVQRVPDVTIYRKRRFDATVESSEAGLRRSRITLKATPGKAAEISNHPSGIPGTSRTFRRNYKSQSRSRSRSPL